MPRKNVLRSGDNQTGIAIIVVIFPQINYWSDQQKYSNMKPYSNEMSLKIIIFFLL